MKMQNEVMFRSGTCFKNVNLSKSRTSSFQSRQTEYIARATFSKGFTIHAILLLRKVYVSLSLKRYQCKKIR